MAFLFFLFIVVYCIPLIILITANTVTLQGLKRMREKIESGIQTALNRKRVEMERRIVRSKFAGRALDFIIILPSQVLSLQRVALFLRGHRTR